MTPDEYNKIKSELRDYLKLAKDNNYWLRVTTNNGINTIGQVKHAGENFLYLKPSLIYEENTPKKDAGLRLEDKFPTLMNLGSVSSVQAMSKRHINELLEKRNEKINGSTGFRINKKINYPK